MQAALFKEKKVIEVEDILLKKISTDELLIKIGACGVCGTDFHIVEGTAPSASPVIIGHEFVGEIVETGSKISELRLGDKVAVDPNIYCGYCEYCRTGKINLCKNLKALGVTLNGGFAEYCIVPSKQAYVIPKNISYNIAAFAEPLSCCIHGVNQADIKVGDNVAIIGAGTIGLLMLQLSLQKGAASVAVSDFSSEKRNIAKKLGANYLLVPEDKISLNGFLELTKGGADIVIECVGNEKAAANSFNLVKRGGTILLFGLAPKQDRIQLYLQSFFHKELTIKSSLLNPFTFQIAVDLLIANKINVEILNPFKVHLSKDGVEKLFHSPRDLSVIKYIVKPNEEVELLKEVK